MFKMTKKKWLSMFTVVAVVVTMTASFAAWDKMSDTQTASVTIGNPTTVDLTANALSEVAGSTSDADHGLTYSGSLVVAKAGDKGDTITLSARVLDGDTPVDASKVDVSFKKGDTALTDGTDSSIATGNNNYTVELVPKSAELGGKTLSVEVTATLSQQ